MKAESESSEQEEKIPVLTNFPIRASVLMFLLFY
jgi:hypothetical protein